MKQKLVQTNKLDIDNNRPDPNIAKKSIKDEINIEPFDPIIHFIMQNQLKPLATVLIKPVWVSS